MISMNRALELVMAGAEPLPPERIPVEAALGRVLAESVHAARTLPPVANSAMDGYAVRAADVAEVPVQLKVVGEVPAGGFVERPLEAKEAYRIFTGAPIPDGADAVIRQEVTEREGELVRIDETCALGNNVRPAGDDVKVGDALIDAGVVLGPGEAAVLAGQGRTGVWVHRQPVVAILSTGDELVAPDEDPGPRGIVNSNNVALAMAVRQAGCRPMILGSAPDDPEAIGRLVDAALAADVIVSTGGVSVGDHDHVKDVFESRGLETGFWRVAVKPGKPVLFGHLGHRAVFGLPGNPVSALTTFQVFARPRLRRMLGHAEDGRPSLRARLSDEAPSAKGRTHLVWVHLERHDGEWWAHPVTRQASHRMAGLVNTHGIIAVPPDQPIEASEEVDVRLMALPARAAV